MFQLWEEISTGETSFSLQSADSICWLMWLYGRVSWNCPRILFIHCQSNLSDINHLQRDNLLYSHGIFEDPPPDIFHGKGMKPSSAFIFIFLLVIGTFFDYCKPIRFHFWILVSYLRKGGKESRYIKSIPLFIRLLFVKFTKYTIIWKFMYWNLAFAKGVAQVNLKKSKMKAGM